MATTWTYRRCGHSSVDGTMGEDRAAVLDGLCVDCRRSRIGATIRFLRFGTIPHGGCSYNHRDRVGEEGVSVYEVNRGKADLVGWYFSFVDRPAYRGVGVIIGWGSDGEPLVHVLSSRRVGPKAVARLLP